MNRIILIAILVSLGGCITGRPGGEYENESTRRMLEADSLAVGTEYLNAARSYAYVAEHYSYSVHATRAMRNAALCFSHPRSGERDDSAALAWYRVYRASSIANDERDQIDRLIELLEEGLTLRQHHQVLSGERDSLAVLAGRQRADLAARENTIRELEIRIKKATDDLQKLRDIDLKTSRRGSKR